MPNDIDLDSALGSDDYEYLQEYMEEHSKYMNERRFTQRYTPKRMLDRLQSERTADVFEIEERKILEGEERGSY